MDNSRLEGHEIVDETITGRVDPHIYAFKTNTVPNYWKIGDTYRPVGTRLNEWMRVYPKLEQVYQEKSIIDEENYFRDYSIHKYLESDLGKVRLLPSDLKNGAYYSKEFFKDICKLDINMAIDDIKANFKENTGKYDYYSAINTLPITHTYVRGEDWELRPNQKEVVENFETAIRNGRNNLLMYAVMRFGKSFTSLCCALRMNARLVLVVSAKADVKEEWKSTVQIAGNFKDYVFLDSDSLLSGDNDIYEIINTDNKSIVLFLTLQDLQGDKIKQKHQQLFKNEVDLLIVDETHFGARAKSYGKILRKSSSQTAEKKNIEKLDDESVDTDDANQQVKENNAKVRLHLSGTPYRILKSTEFDKEDIISFVQFTDIVNEQKKWDEEYLIDDDINEWDNPYFGFPQMVRFAFNPNKSSREKMMELKRSGHSFTLSKLLEPQSITVDNEYQKHKKFVNEKEVLDLLQVIDGSKEDEEILGFLDYDKIKEGKMCRHIVMVLPYCASCDAMEALISSNKHKFKNLNEYEIVNISGLNSSKKYKNTNQVKTKINKCESEDKKTVTLTVNRMLTGSTVRQWDTMIYLKDTSSPQEYDQAIFRLQNQYIRTFKSGDDIIKQNLKPQTLLVDFDPNRLFIMQEQKSLIYNANTDKTGNTKLKDRIEEEVRISPIITMNHNKIKKVTARNILEVISNYNNSRSVADEVLDMVVDLSILEDDEVKKVINMQGEFSSRQGLTIYPYEDEEDALDLDDPYKEPSQSNNENTSDNKDKKTDDDKVDEDGLENKIKTYYLRILFYTFLSNDKVVSLDDILQKMDGENNQRIAQNLSLDKAILEKISRLMKTHIRTSLDYSIQRISSLANDEDLSPIERAMTSIKRFDRMSDSEVVTPARVCNDMINLLPEESIKQIVENEHKFLDLGCKAGEYTVAIYNRLTNGLGYRHDEVDDLIYSIPTSPIAYEFTRKFYEILGLNVNNIAANFTAYDLLEIKDKDGNIDYEMIKEILEQNKNFSDIKFENNISGGDNKVKFGAVVGNPPYQLTLKKATKGNNASTKDIYNYFKNIALEISNVNVMLYPAKEYQRGTKDYMDSDLQYLRIYNGSNKKQEKNIPDEPSIFGDSVRRIPGDVGLFYWNKELNSDYFIYQGKTIKRTDKILPVRKEFLTLADKLKAEAGLFKIGKIKKACESSFVENYPEYVLGEVKDRKAPTPRGYSKVLTNNIAGSGGKAHWFYIRTDKLKNEQPRVFKVVTGSAYPNESLKDIKNVEILAKDEMFGRTKVSLYSSENKIDAENFLKFLKTSFGKAITHMTPLKVLYYMPDFDKLKDDIEWTKSIDEIDEQLFNKYELTEEEKAHIKSSIKDM